MGYNFFWGVWVLWGGGGVGRMRHAFVVVFSDFSLLFCYFVILYCALCLINAKM